MQEKKILEWVEQMGGTLEAKANGYYLEIPGFEVRFGKTIEKVYERVRPMVEMGILRKEIAE